jgi:hypothetical protein
VPIEPSFVCSIVPRFVDLDECAIYQPNVKLRHGGAQHYEMGYRISSPIASLTQDEMKMVSSQIAPFDQFHRKNHTCKHYHVSCTK